MSEHYKEKLCIKCYTLAPLPPPNHKHAFKMFVQSSCSALISLTLSSTHLSMHRFSFNSHSSPFFVIANVRFAASPVPQQTPQNTLFLCSPNRAARPFKGTVSLYCEKEKKKIVKWEECEKNCLAPKAEL